MFLKEMSQKKIFYTIEEIYGFKKSYEMILQIITCVLE